MCIPVDFDDLVQKYGHVIKQVSGSDDLLHVWRIAEIMVSRGVLEVRPSAIQTSYPAMVMARKHSQGPFDLCKIVGISFDTWKSFVNGCLKGARKGGKVHRKPEGIQKLRPRPVEGGSSYGGPFPIAEVLRLRDHREAVIEGKRVFQPRGLKDLESPEFIGFLTEKVREAQAELDANRGFQRPEHLPQTDAEVYSMFQAQVAAIVRRSIKYGIRFEDAIQEVWSKILGANLLHRFVQSATQHIPYTITADEAVEFLGIKWDAWIQMFDAYEHAPVPQKGSVSSPKARFLGSDILQLDESGYFSRRDEPRRLPDGAVTLARLENYVKRAASNHAKNLLRRQTRRFSKEHTLKKGAVLSRTGDVFEQKTSVDENASWEMNLSDTGLRVDEVYDAYSLARKLGVEYDTPAYYEAISNLVKGVELPASSSPEGCMSFLNLLADGCPPKEALKRQQTQQNSLLRQAYA